MELKFRSRGTQTHSPLNVLGQDKGTAALSEQNMLSHEGKRNVVDFSEDLFVWSIGNSFEDPGEKSQGARGCDAEEGTPVGTGQQPVIITLRSPVIL